MAQYQGRTGPLVNDPAPFSPEMAQGSRPPNNTNRNLGTKQRSDFCVNVIAVAAVVAELAIAFVGPVEPPRLFRPYQPPPIAQVTHVAAPFSPEMIAGSNAGNGHYALGERTDPINPPMIPAPLGVEMVAGSNAGSGRYYPAPCILPLQPIIVPPPVGIEMTAGYNARAGLYTQGKRTDPVNPPIVDTPISPEMAHGSSAGKGKYLAGPFIQPVSPPDLPRRTDEAAYHFADSPAQRIRKARAESCFVVIACVPPTFPENHPTPMVLAPPRRQEQSHPHRYAFSVVTEVFRLPEVTRPHGPRLPRLHGGITIDPIQVDPFRIESVSGSNAGASRLRINQRGRVIDPIKVDPAEFDGIYGSNAGAARTHKPTRASIISLSHVFEFPIETVEGSNEGPSHLRIASRARIVEPITISNSEWDGVFSGNRPHSPRILLAKQRPADPYQHTPVDVIFVPDYTTGYHPDQPPRLTYGKVAWYDNQPILQIPPDISPEMMAGNTSQYGMKDQRARQIPLPDLIFILDLGLEPSLMCVDHQSRLTYPQHIQPLSQSSQIDAPFSPEMIAGSPGVSARIRLAARIPLPISQVTPVLVFSPEMFSGAQGVTFPSPRIQLASRIPLPPTQETPVVLVSPEMVAGAQGVPPRARILRGQIGLSIAQTTHISAPFGPEMVIGYHPDKPRIVLAQKIPLPISVTDRINAVTQEMINGYHPDKPRIYYPAQGLPQPITVILPFEALRIAIGDQLVTDLLLSDGPVNIVVGSDGEIYILRISDRTP